MVGEKTAWRLDRCGFCAWGWELIAACLIIPQADTNRRLVYQREQLKLDLTQVQKQIGLNKEFLLKMESDPQLTERLAQREMPDRSSRGKRWLRFEFRVKANSGKRASSAGSRCRRLGL